MRRREVGEWTSRRPRNLAAGCSDMKLNLAAARFRGNTVYLLNLLSLIISYLTPPLLSSHITVFLIPSSFSPYFVWLVCTEAAYPPYLQIRPITSSDVQSVLPNHIIVAHHHSYLSQIIYPRLPASSDPLPT